MTPDQPITLFVTVLCSTLCVVLPLQYAIVPLLVAMIAYPSNVMVPPDALQLSAQRVIGLVLFLRCATSPEVRAKFKWTFVDTAAAAYFLLELLAQLMTTEPVSAINNRGGYFLSAMVPFWCVRFLITDRQRLYALLKGLLWTSLPLVALGFYQAQVGDSPYRVIMENGIMWTNIKFQWAERRAFMGRTTFRASAPFGQCIMFGWMFAIQFAPATNLFWQKRKLFPAIIPWLLLPLGTINTVSAGPMSMAAMSLALCGLFPFRKHWKLIFGAAGAVYLGITLFANRGPMELVASQGLDQSSSWYRVNLINFTKNGAMAGHWIAGYGSTPAVYEQYHDLCIQWISLVVTHGVLGLVGFHVFVAAAAWCLWVGKKRSTSVEDDWLLWSLMCTLLATFLAMQVVSLFGEMFYLYHLFLGLVANSMIVVGGAAAGGLRHVGVMAELNGRRVLLRYALKPGQKLAFVPTAAAAAPEPRNPVPLSSRGT